MSKQDHEDLKDRSDAMRKAEAVGFDGKPKFKNLNDKANSRQVGGTHYKTGGIELWDLFGPEALMFYAVRYVARWRKKDGLRDLEKGKHVVEKLRELGCARRPMLPVDRSLVESWAKNQGCDWVEQTIILRIMFWETKHDINEAIRGIEYLIQTHGKVPSVKEQLESFGGVTWTRGGTVEALGHVYGTASPWVGTVEVLPKIETDLFNLFHAHPVDTHRYPC